MNCVVLGGFNKKISYFQLLRIKNHSKSCDVILWTTPSLYGFTLFLLQFFFFLAKLKALLKSQNNDLKTVQPDLSEPVLRMRLSRYLLCFQRHVPHQPNLLRRRHRPLPQHHPRPQLPLAGEGAKLGIHQPGSHLSPGQEFA